jgi:hypothetical protein
MVLFVSMLFVLTYKGAMEEEEGYNYNYALKLAGGRLIYN